MTLAHHADVPCFAFPRLFDPDRSRSLPITPDQKGLRSTMDPLSLSTTILGLVSTAIKLVVGARGMINDTVAVHDEAEHELNGLQQDLEQLKTQITGIHGTMTVLTSRTKDRAFKKLLQE